MKEEKLRAEIEEFLANGGDLEQIRQQNRKLYDKVKYWEKIVDGKALSLSEKFALLGFDREKRYKTISKEALTQKIDEYLKSGGSFHVKRKSLPFFEDVRSYRRKMQQKDISFCETMKNLGYKNYSDIYYQYSFLNDVKNYRDENGFVDGLRKDAKFYSKVRSMAEYYDIPIPVVVELFAGEKLKKYSLKDADRLSYVKTLVEKYLQENENLEGLKRKNSKLYDLLKQTGASLAWIEGRPLTIPEVLSLIDIDAKYNSKPSRTQMAYVQEQMEKLRKLAEEKNFAIKREDLDKEGLRSFVIRQSYKMDISIGEWLATFGIDYQLQKPSELVRYKVLKNIEKFPYMDEMIAKRDEMLASTSKEGLCEEELFEQRFEICMKAYEQFKDKIAESPFGETEPKTKSVEEDLGK